jgi:hypothetical protein
MLLCELRSAVCGTQACLAPAGFVLPDELDAGTWLALSPYSPMCLFTPVAAVTCSAGAALPMLLCCVLLASYAVGSGHYLYLASHVLL